MRVGIAESGTWRRFSRLALINAVNIGASSVTAASGRGAFGAATVSASMRLLSGGGGVGRPPRRGCGTIPPRQKFTMTALPACGPVRGTTVTMPPATENSPGACTSVRCA